MRQLEDTSVLAGWRSSLFVFRQWFVLVPGILGTLVAGAGMIALTIENGRATTQTILMLVAIAPLCGFGFAVLTGLPAFMVARALSKPRPPFSPSEGETIVTKERANHFLGDEGRGGELVLTDRRIVFVPHRFNVQLASVEQPLAGVRAVEWGRVVGANGIPLSNVLWVVEGARRERYVVQDAATLGARIEQTAQLRSAP